MNKTAKSKKNLFHEHRQIHSSIITALIVSIVLKSFELIDKESVIAVFLVISVLWYLMHYLRYPIKDEAKYQSYEVEYNFEEMLVASKNAGLKLIGSHGNIFSFKPKHLWLNSPVLEIIDYGSRCKVIANNDACESLIENILIQPNKSKK